jgi:hypothetical protein
MLQVIDKELPEAIFEPLKRGTGHERHPGLGLGLYDVRENGKCHGGTAEARSDDRNAVLHGAPSAHSRRRTAPGPRTPASKLAWLGRSTRTRLDGA